MKRKIILTDVDGTLIPYSDTNPPKSVKEAVDELHKNGHLVYTVTGRTLAHMNGGLKEICFDGMIGGNGAFIKVGDDLYKERTVSLEDTKVIVDYLIDKGLDFFIETVDGMYGSYNFEFNAVETYKKYGIKNPVIRDMYPLMQFPKNLYVERVTKINYILKSYQDYLDVKERFPEFKVLTWGGQGEHALFGDIALEGIDKCVAVKELLEYLNIDKEDAIGFGDADVDIPLFEACGTSVCMGDGREKAKASATFITDTAGNDGWMKACKHFKLI